MDASEIRESLSLLVAPGPLEKGGSQGRHQDDGWGRPGGEVKGKSGTAV